MVAEAWQRLKMHWSPFLLAGLIVSLVNGLAGAVGVLAVANVMGGLIGQLADVDTLRSTSTVGFMSELVAALSGWAWIVPAIWLLAGPFVKAGLQYMVVNAQHGGADRGFWQAGVRYWSRFLRYQLLQLLVLTGLVGSFLVMAEIPVLGMILWLLAVGPVVVALYGYAPYVMVAEDLGPGAAFATGWRALTACYGELFKTCWVLVLMATLLMIAATWAGRALSVPVLADLLAETFWVPWSLLYLGVRYERLVGPALTPPGGGGGFHINPPTGS